MVEYASIFFNILMTHFLKEVTDFWLTEMKNNSIWLKNETKFKSDETKRAGKAISHADVFGVEGSFRKLDID